MADTCKGCKKGSRRSADHDKACFMHGVHWGREQDEGRARRQQRQAERAQQEAAKRRQLEDNVLAAAANLDPADNSLDARQIRETAGSIRDHRSSPR